jgi:hypothetical protein
MRIATRLMTLFGRGDLEKDLRTEVEFHIQMRVESYVKDGKAPEEADALARIRFGDVEEVMNGMRYARLRSTTAALIAATSLGVMVTGLLLYRAASPGAPIVFPPLPGVPLQTRERRVPPPPPPPPTWEEFVAKVNTFGDSGDSKSRRR